MYTYKKNSEKNRTASFDITLKKEAVDKQYEEELKKLSKDVKVEGFRKGKAPFELAKKLVKPEKAYDNVLQKMLGDAYAEIVKKEDLKPVISPQIKVKKAEPKSDWVIEIIIALEPKVTIPDYKKIVKDVKASTKKDDIWVPGKDKDIKDPNDQEQMAKRQKLLNSILDEIVKKTKIELSDVIIEQEMNNRLSRLVDDAQKIGLTMEAYLASKGLSEDKLKEQFKKEIQETYKVEYALSKIGDKEKISVEESDLTSMLDSAHDEAAQEQMKRNMYFYSTIIRKQKILDFLASL